MSNSKNSSALFELKLTPEVKTELQKLNPHQREVTLELLDAMAEGQQFQTLSGPAGTGKTYSLAVIIKLLGLMGVSCAVAAPTHKAVKVIREKLAVMGAGGVECMTLHKALGLVLVKNEDEYETVRMKDVVACDVLFVDESSMINEDLVAFVRSGINCEEFKAVVFCGDSYQLPPVVVTDETKSSAIEIALPFHEEFCAQYRLTEVVRNAGDILALATTIRKSMRQHQPYTPFKSEWQKDDVWFVGYEQAIEGYVEALKVDAAHADGTRFLFYTNDMVDKTNDLVRQKTYGMDVETVLEGERVVIQHPVTHVKVLPQNKDTGEAKSFEEIWINNNEECAVGAVKKGCMKVEFGVPTKIENGVVVAKRGLGPVWLSMTECSPDEIGRLYIRTHKGELICRGIFGPPET